ncbi:hypothetical protein GPLA_1263 [Paraglaciecola polaris LMG 21857]|uniref:Uncharacterized protein n=1 Tax=Paraglaciecola polaris LMG 21857 TaxID=1129793 RepID=K6ZTM5_9ALTE|nr:hypothetical protein GPLA_1263 [Paraglaciecola polaris LMG 21857]
MGTPNYIRYDGHKYPVNLTVAFLLKAACAQIIKVYLMNGFHC